MKRTRKMDDRNEMKDSEILVLKWLIDQDFSERKIHRIPDESPDFILEMGNEKKVYVEATECGWLTSLGDDDRGLRSDLRRIVRDEVKNVRESDGLAEESWIGIRLEWPYEFIPSRESVGSAGSRNMKKEIREKIQGYGEYLESCVNNSVRDSSALKEESLTLGGRNVDAKFWFWKRRIGKKGDHVEVDICEGNKASLETSRYVSIIEKSLFKKTTKKVKGREGGFFEYWLVLVDKSSMLMGVDHKPDAEEWRRRDWDIAREEIGKDPKVEYWDRILVVSDCNDGMEHIEIIDYKAED